ncbi:hypothetical protein H310_12868 [Aphanomyces invadans]|uniref:Ketoreductase domain-containing protein n=1 Tax=Aphanomyces invadans TaxID=157072 RepID=A0A024TG99_9STRA|nr:hypothetical protein H310_12868 [Aphanomyces invadans]ETV93068.1 hypothetical protein H310_12868 [Aphanomyces invadans]|eukprot:XP_008878334.1 hypothetical protein H310_12868 [Aphanomyces invadans]
MAFLRFDGQVAVVTGAGGGLGQEWARALYARGATCVLVDIDPRVLQLVKPAVTSDAKWECVVANCANEKSGRQVIENVLTTHGRVDILIHASTQVQDAAFRKMTRSQWDAVLENDLTSAFTMTRAVWSSMRQQNYGRILLCTSASGLYGNFGQVNYATTKSGIWGLTKALSVEGRKYKIAINAIAAVAGTSLTQSGKLSPVFTFHASFQLHCQHVRGIFIPLWSPVMPDDVYLRLKPEYTAPIVVYLCHASSSENGGVFETGGAWVGKLRLQRSQGAGFPLVVTPEVVAAAWDQVVDFSAPAYPASTQESFEPMLHNVNHPPEALHTPQSKAVVAVFHRLRQTLAKLTTPLRPSGGHLQWTIGTATYSLSLATNEVVVVDDSNAAATTADLTLETTEHDFLDLVAGTLRLQQALAGNKLKMRGDMKLAMRLQPLLKLFQGSATSKL